MADKVINAIILEATNTEAVWIEKNPVLRKGQLAISSDKNGKYKVGDGTSTWTQLSYAKANLSSSDVTTALGFTPATSNHTHNLASTSANGYLRQLDGSTAHFLRGDGTWATPPAPSLMKGATASAAGTAGLVPAPAIGNQASFLRGDGTWQSISLSTLGVTVTAAELNYMDGVTSNVQIQLNEKAATSHTHTKAQITDFPTSLKNPQSLSITTGSDDSGMSSFNYDGSAATSINITAASIGAAASSHTHSYLPLSGGTLTGTVTFQNNYATGEVLQLLPSSSGITSWKVLMDRTTLYLNAYDPYDDSLTYSYKFSRGGIVSINTLEDLQSITCFTGNFSSLKIQDSSSVQLQLQSTSSNTSTVGIYFKNSSVSSNASMVFYPATNALNFFTTGGINFTLGKSFYISATGGITISGQTVQIPGLASTTYAPNTYINGTGYLYLSSSSSRRYKYNITENISASLDPTRLYDLPVVQYQYNPGYLGCDPMGTQCHIGFIAEDIADIYPVAAEYNPDGTVEMWNFKEILPGMLKLIQDQHTVQEDHEKRITELEAEVAYWKGKFESGT